MPGDQSAAHTAVRPHGRRPGSERPRLLRSRERRWLTGLCAGIAELTGYDAGRVRLMFVATTLVTLGVVAVGYLALSLIVPAQPR